MNDGRKILDELRGVFQEGVDDLERVGSRKLDRLASLGVRELEQLRDEMSAVRRAREEKSSSSRRSLNGKVSRKLKRHAKHLERGRRGKRPRGRSRGSRRAEEAELSPEEREERRLIRLARKRANQRIGFVMHLGSYVATLALLLVTTRSVRVALVVGLGWGIGVFSHYLWSIAAPRLRDRWVEEEVGTRSARGVKHERKEVENRSRKSMEDLSASIAHEIRNPITAAKSLVQQMGEDPAQEENLEYADLALSELDRVERSISHLLRYARDEEPRFEALDLSVLARAAAAGLRDRAASEGVELFVDFETPAPLRGDPEKLRRVIENLITNAIEAVADEPVEKPRVEVLGGVNLAGSAIWIRVRDNGAGIPLEEQEKIWSPFFTTKEEGTGLGLALSRKTIEAHGGQIELISDTGLGSEFVLSFPLDASGQ